MSVADSYANAEAYRARIRKTDSGQDSSIEDDLLAVSRYIDRRLNRFFTKDDSPVARVGTPGFDMVLDRDGVLFVDDIASLTGLEIRVDDDRDGLFNDQGLLVSTDYQVRPINAPYGPEPRPWTQIYLVPWGTRRAWFFGYQVQITALWGWPAVPKAIEVGCIHLTSILRLESSRATRTVNELGQVLSTSRQAQDILTELIDAYGRKEL
jgi:hypothetical protein